MYALCSENTPLFPWNETYKIQKGSSWEELSKHIAVGFLFPNNKNIYATRKAKQAIEQKGQLETAYT